LQEKIKYVVDTAIHSIPSNPNGHKGEVLDMKLHDGNVIAASRKETKSWNIKKGFADNVLSYETDSDITSVCLQPEVGQVYTASSQTVTVWDLKVISY
jgi:hypothetical protein